MHPNTAWPKLREDQPGVGIGSDQCHFLQREATDIQALFAIGC